MPIPDGYVDIEIRIKPDGSFERKIVREGKSVCKNGDEKSILEDLMNAKIEGFEGDFGNIIETKNTKDHWESQRVGTSSPQEYTINKKSKGKLANLNDL